MKCEDLIPNPCAKTEIGKQKYGSTIIRKKKKKIKLDIKNSILIKYELSLCL